MISPRSFTLSLPLAPVPASEEFFRSKIDNTSLSFDQIANFVGLHNLEIQAIADGEVSAGILAKNPIESGDLSSDEIKKCEKNPKLNLKMLKIQKQ